MKEQIKSSASKAIGNRDKADNLLARTQGMVFPVIQSLGYDVFDLAGVAPDKGEGNTIVVDVKEDDLDKIRVFVGASVPAFPETPVSAPVVAMTDGTTWKFMSGPDREIGTVSLDAGIDEQDLALLESLAAGVDVKEAINGLDAKRFSEALRLIGKSFLFGGLDPDIRDLAAKAAGVDPAGLDCDLLHAAVKEDLVEAMTGKVLDEQAKAASELDDDEQAAADAFLDMAGDHAEKIEIKKTTGYIALLADNNVRRWLCRIYLAGKTRVSFKDGRTVEFASIGELAGMRDQFLEAMKAEGMSVDETVDDLPAEDTQDAPHGDDTVPGPDFLEDGPETALDEDETESGEESDVNDLFGDNSPEEDGETEE